MIELGKADSVFEVIGPIMIGPSSSHTAAAVRMGQITSALLKKPVKKVMVGLHGSFASTGKGHGTDKAIAAGLLGFDPADERIRGALKIAEEEGMEIEFHNVDLGDDYHPNTARLEAEDEHRNSLVVTASSLGGGTISVVEINGLEIELSGEYDTLITIHRDKPGIVAKATTIIAEYDANISSMKVTRARRGGQAIMAVEMDHSLSPEAIEKLEKIADTVRVIPPIY
ncbi:L-serine ammonia-lyase, iron-sulfur-dependent, subunit beta [Candidatus Bathyarchaeota archaeon]|nr:L-serine ammonia-lyase, iron-sulfur-dependent, subunit beta [Candidatus Bathyarchaeota archaeon]